MRILITILIIQFSFGFALLIPPKEEERSKIEGLAKEKDAEKPEVTKEEKRESEEKDELIPEEKPEGKDDESDTKNKENPQDKAKRGEDTIASIPGNNVTVNTQPRLKQDFSIVSSKEHETSKDRKRKREDKSKVWNHFNEEDGIATCKECDQACPQAYAVRDSGPILKLKAHLEKHGINIQNELNYDGVPKRGNEEVPNIEEGDGEAPNVEGGDEEVADSDATVSECN
uniref:BED-type domain-containing protein n=1 Tax=Meloidogyne javanica TaxID=6303 RepID=A0A915M9G6_MELJA